MVFWGLGYPSLLDPDEAHYAELTREMLQSGNWLVPLLDGKPFIDKPVLFHWLQGASVALLGETAFAARLPTAIAALALFAVTRRVGTILFGAEVGEWGAIMFATIPATFALASVALFDMVFTAFLFSAVGCLLVAATTERRRVEYAGYGLLTLAVMTKGPVALLLVGLFIVVASMAARDMRDRLRWLRWKTGLVCVLAAASPWFLWMAIHFGSEFVQGYLLAGNLWYFTQPEVFSSRAISHTFYVRAFTGAFFPWSTVLIGRGVDVLRRARAGLAVATQEKLLWTWILVVIGFFTLARFKLDHYIFPAAPAVCLLAAHAWREAVLEPDGHTQATRLSVLAIAGILVLFGSFGSVYIFRIDLHLPPVAIVLPVTLAAGGIVLMTQAARRGWIVPRHAAVPVVTLLIAYIVVVTVGFPVLEGTRPTALVATRLRLASPEVPVALFQLERWRASLRYYLGRPVDRLSSIEEVRAFVARPEPVYIVMLRRNYDALRREGIPIHMVMRRPAVVGTTGRGLRRQQWGYLVVATNVPRHQHSRQRGRMVPP